MMGYFSSVRGFWLRKFHPILQGRTMGVSSSVRERSLYRNHLSERAMLGLQQQLLRNATLWNDSEPVTVKDCSEQGEVLMFKERALRMQFEDGGETFVNRAGVSCCIVSRGIEDAVWLYGMFAKSSGPSLRDGVRAAEQTGVCSDAGEPP